MNKLRLSILDDDNLSSPQMELYLVPDEAGGPEILLKGRDSDGKEWKIATISPQGIYLVEGIESSTGWPLTKDGAVKLLKVDPR